MGVTRMVCEMACGDEWGSRWSLHLHLVVKVASGRSSFVRFLFFYFLSFCIYTSFSPLLSLFHASHYNGWGKKILIACNNWMVYKQDFFCCFFFQNHFILYIYPFSSLRYLPCFIIPIFPLSCFIIYLCHDPCRTFLDYLLPRLIPHTPRTHTTFHTKPPYMFDTLPSMRIPHIHFYTRTLFAMLLFAFFLFAITQHMYPMFRTRESDLFF